MKKTCSLIIAVVLMSGAGFARETSETITKILDELESYIPAPAAVEQPAPDTAVSKREAATSAPQKSEAAAATEPIMNDAVMADVPKDFENAVSPEPKAESIFARMNPTTLKERDQRTMETKGMNEVKAAWSTELVFRSYALSSDACQRMGMEGITDSTDVADHFPQVKFPEGSSAIYQPDMNALFVRNTRQNFVVLETILGAMDLAKLSSDVDQVEIEAKFVEVSEGTLEELGFEWNFDNPISTHIGGTDIAVDDGANGLFANGLRGSPSGNPNLPFSKTSDMGDGVDPATGDWAAFGIANTFNSTPDSLRTKYIGSDSFELLISALDQSSGIDVLSAPRVTTRCGEEATIRVGEIHSYPEVYEGGSSEATLLNINYRDFTETLLGVQLSVTPYISGDNIVLNLNPQITELAGWQKYLLAPKDSIYNHRYEITKPTYKHDAIVARLPMFKKRVIQTEVTIADGSTIGMGGLINEKIESFEDKVPVLGSIPLVGRLFRNEGERVVKRNLLMFVTAKKVEPSGRVNTSRTIE